MCFLAFTDDDSNVTLQVMHFTFIYAPILLKIILQLKNFGSMYRILHLLHTLPTWNETLDPSSF